MEQVGEANPEEKKDEDEEEEDCISQKESSILR